MRILINNSDCSSLFPENGQKVEYLKVHGNAGGIMLDGSEVEDVLKRKAKIELTPLPMSEEAISAFLALLFSDTYASVTYYDPLAGEERSIEAIYSEPTAEKLFRNIHGVDMWKLDAITLTER